MEYKFKAWQPFEGCQTIAIEDHFDAIMWGLEHQVDIFMQDNELVYSPNDDEESNFERLEKYGVKCIDYENGRTWERIPLQSNKEQIIDIEKMAEIIDVNTRTLWSVSLGGNQRQIELYERIKEVNVGDLVVETSSTFMYPAINRIGYLKEVFQDEDGWTHYIIERLNGKTMDWSNCKFIKALTDFEHFVS